MKKYILSLVVALSLLPSLAGATNFRADLQKSYNTYLENGLHYKVFALKHEDDRWDGWFTWGYDDLDRAMADAVSECSKGVHVTGNCQVYAVGNTVVAGLGDTAMAEKRTFAI